MYKNGSRTHLLIQFYKEGYRVIGDKVININSDKELMIYTSSKGYPCVKMCRKGLGDTEVGVHMLVAYEKFGDQIIDGVLFKRVNIRHMDNNKKNFSANNIEIGTPKDNTNDGSRISKEEISKKISNKTRGFSDTIGRDIIVDRVYNKLSYKKLAQKYNSNASTIWTFINVSNYGKELLLAGGVQGTNSP